MVGEDHRLRALLHTDHGRRVHDLHQRRSARQRGRHQVAHVGRHVHLLLDYIHPTTAGTYAIVWAVDC